jgi:hypothetical protein
MFAYGKHIDTRLLPDGDKWLLINEWWFSWSGEKGDVHVVIPPSTFVTDFASIPRFYRWRFSPTGKCAPAALAHDYLYRQAELPRDVCDQVFLDGMKACGVGWWDRHVMHKAVRIGGWAAYGKAADEPV